MNGTINFNNNYITNSNYINILNKRSFTKRRSESIGSKSLTNFPPSVNEPYDKETMKDEMNKLIKEINTKTKEFKSLLNSHIQTEAENLKTIKQIENIIGDCKQIHNPIERNNSVSLISSNKNKSLVNNLQETLNSYEQTLFAKQKHLEELKKTNPKILRLFDIENKLVTANQKYIAVYKKNTEAAKKLFDLEVESVKATGLTEQFKKETNKLKQEAEDLKEKIKNNNNENNELAVKERLLEEKNATTKGLFAEIKNSMKENEDELEQIKEKMIEYKTLINNKGKQEAILSNQMKQIQGLKESNYKKNNQIKEIEKIQTDYLNEVNNIKAIINSPNNKLIPIQKEKKSKEEEYERSKRENERLKKVKSDMMDKPNPSPFQIQKQISYSCNIPLVI